MLISGNQNRNFQFSSSSSERMQTDWATWNSFKKIFL